MSPASRLADQRGMSIVEVMVAALVLAVGVLATMNVVLGSRDLTTTSEKLEAASHVAEKELEEMQSLTWAAQAHSAIPASGPAPYTVAGTGVFQWPAGATAATVVTPGVGTVPAGSTTWSDGRLSGRVWRFISWFDDPCCLGPQNYKRLTVVVTVNGRPRLDNPVVLSTFSAEKQGV
jgi:prepilin-type N-terminal cleavage/methylation domain-containing protein